MKRERRKFSTAFKAKVALEAIKERRRFNSLLPSMRFIRTRFRFGKRSFGRCESNLLRDLVFNHFTLLKYTSERKYVEPGHFVLG